MEKENAKNQMYKELLNTEMLEAYKNKFIKVPGEFFKYLHNDDKLLIVLLSLFKRKTIYNTITITLKDIILENNFIPTKGKNRNIEQFKVTLFNLIKLNIIEFYNPKLNEIIKEEQKWEEKICKLKNQKQIETKTKEYTLLFETITLNTPINLRFNEENVNELTTNNFTMLQFNITNIFKTICTNNPKIKMNNLTNIYLMIKRLVDANAYYSNSGWNISIEYFSKHLKLSRQTVCDTIKELEKYKIIFVTRKEHKNYYRLTERNNVLKAMKDHLLT